MSQLHLPTYLGISLYLSLSPNYTYPTYLGTYLPTALARS